MSVRVEGRKSGWMRERGDERGGKEGDLVEEESGRVT